MVDWIAPAKINLSLEVRPPDQSGYHPIRSLVQSIEWCDLIRIEVGDEDRLVVTGADLPDGGDNLVWKAVDRLVGKDRPPLDFLLEKRVAVGAGLGGGSSDAAAALTGVAGLLRIPDDRVAAAAAEVGADVSFFLRGGTAVIEGYGERVSDLPGLRGFAVAVVVPPFELSTPEVYRRWDDLGYPVGRRIQDSDLPPALRGGPDLRNDLTPAALSLRPDLGDWLADLTARWGMVIAMSGSGPSLFGLFPNLDEAESAVGGLPTTARASAAAALRPSGVAIAPV
jgi:4-diphosphocytidyl-2-C-methyl-D-erythritol kinase